VRPVRCDTARLDLGAAYSVLEVQGDKNQCHDH
jgi:hypothetical protein